MKPKLCYIVPEYLPNSSQHFAHLPRFLSALGKHVDLYVIIEKCKGIPVIDNVKEIYPQRYGYSNRLLRMLELAAIIIKLRRKGCRKFFIRISITAGLVTCLLAKFLCIKTYYWQSGQGKSVIPGWLSDVKGFLERFKYEIRLIPFYVISKLTNYFVTGPESMAHYYANYYGVNSKKIIVLYNDIDLERFQGLISSKTKRDLGGELRLPTDCKIILFLHWLSPRKGVTYLTPLALAILKVIKNVIFLVIGGGPYQKQLEKEIYDKRLHQYFKVLGAVPNNEAFKYYGCADVFILPSKEEGFPRVLLEAMASGIPFVAFDVGGVKDIIDDAQQNWIVPRGDVKVFANRIIELLNNPQLCKQLGETGLEQVKKFDTKKVVRMFVERIVNT